ncbi:MAG: pitrilysin family protein [Saprospiraceae bacterium]|nr:pitrilysin family protein [Saprospiraceae bacterium]
MKRLFFLGLFCLSLLTPQSLFSQDLPTYDPNSIDVPYKKFVLPNGLRLVVHEDHKAPIVAVNVWYHVGSKNEKPGKSGFAHLFEHLMFNGSEHFNTDYFQALEAIGGTDLNGTTNDDRTNYFQNVPVGALDQVLWLESDRMGHLLGAIDQGKLDEQRGVVQNEKRQGENQPYAKGWDILQKEAYPPYHPYGHTVIGEMEDLNAASVADVHEWFKTYYGAANAVLVVAGDITPEAAYEKVLKYFGNIPAGPTIARPEVNVAKRTGSKRVHYQDRVPESRIVISWNTPEWGNKENAALDLASSVLSSGKSSRFFKKLVYEKQICSSVNTFNGPSEIGGGFGIIANVKKGKTVEEVEAAIHEIMAEFIKNGPTEEELKRVKASYFAGFLKGLERIGGFGGKSDLLAENEVYAGSPDFYKTYNLWINQVTAKEVQMVCQKWLTDGDITMVCDPFQEYSVSGVETDRSKPPAVDNNVAAKFPNLQRATLKNGMKVVLARRTESPTFSANIMFDAGYCTDKFGGKLGLAKLGMDMLDEGTKSLNSLQINERLQLLGASLNTFSDLDNSYVGLNTLKQSLDQSLDLLADVVLNPSFPEADFKRLQAQQISGIQNEKKNPQSMVMRVMPSLLYGEGHPYAMPMSGSGEEESVNNISLDDIKGFYGKWLRPNNATIVVTGDITIEELTAKLEKRFSGWQKGELTKKVIPEVKTSTTSNKIFLIDRPESQQSLIVAGYLTKPYGQLDETAIEQMNNVLGGDFTSRINMNIREDKRWSYGARSMIQNTRGQRPFMVFAPVQTDKTKESIQEVIKEVNQFVGDKQMTQTEFDKTKQNTVLGMSGMWETNAAVNGSVRDVVKYNLPDDYWQKYGNKVQTLTLKDVQATAKSIVQPNNLGWFLAGDAAKTLPGLQQLGMEVIQIDANGKVVSTKPKP